jgi:hypothetical protein
MQRENMDIVDDWEMDDWETCELTNVAANLKHKEERELEEKADHKLTRELFEMNHNTTTNVNTIYVKPAQKVNVSVKTHVFKKKNNKIEQQRQMQREKLKRKQNNEEAFGDYTDDTIDEYCKIEDKYT